MLQRQRLKTVSKKAVKDIKVTKQVLKQLNLESLERLERENENCEVPPACRGGKS